MDKIPKRSTPVFGWQKDIDMDEEFIADSLYMLGGNDDIELVADLEW